MGHREAARGLTWTNSGSGYWPRRRRNAWQRRPGSHRRRLGRCSGTAQGIADALHGSQKVDRGLRGTREVPLDAGRQRLHGAAQGARDGARRGDGGQVGQARRDGVVPQEGDGREGDRGRSRRPAAHCKRLRRGGRREAGEYRGKDQGLPILHSSAERRFGFLAFALVALIHSLLMAFRSPRRGPSGFLLGILF